MLGDIIVVCKIVAGAGLIGAACYAAYKGITGWLRGTETPSLRFLLILAVLMFIYLRL